MNKRNFLAAIALGSAALPSLARTPKDLPSSRGPALLTVTGAIGKGNRGSINPALDQLMNKQGVKFDKAHAFDFSALTALPAVAIRPTLEYDNKAHALSGPLLSDVIAATGATMNALTAVQLRAIDGYVIVLTPADIRHFQYIVATHLDMQPIPLGGLGPLWGIYEPDRFPEAMAKPLAERFATCPWVLYHMELRNS
jgi:hypothetical protein